MPRKSRAALAATAAPAVPAEPAAEQVRRHEDDVYSVVLYRHYRPPCDKHDEPLPGVRRMNQYAEAVLHRVLATPGVPALLMAMNGEWIPRAKGEAEDAEFVVELEPDVRLRLTRCEQSPWDVNALELTLTSKTRSATDLVAFVERAYDDYATYVNTSLSSRICFFDQKDHGDFRGNPYDGTANEAAKKKYDIINAPPHLSFVQLPFHSNKSFANLCGPEVRQIAQRVEFFVHNRAWYDAKGIPYQLGLMFSGCSGSGKSSCVRAIANYTGRHVVNVNFANVKTVTQMKKLFYSDDVYVYKSEDGRECTKLRVPIDKRIIVMEEIDALGSTIFDRRGGNGGAATGLADEITLGHMLQVLDGNMETPGRMIVVTSNRPDLLDEALIRPGRIDMNVQFRPASRETIGEMYAKLNDADLPREHLAGVPDGQLSSADAMEVMFRNFGRPAEQTVEDLAQHVQARRDPEATQEGGADDAHPPDRPAGDQCDQFDNEQRTFGHLERLRVVMQQRPTCASDRE